MESAQTSPEWPVSSPLTAFAGSPYTLAPENTNAPHAPSEGLPRIVTDCTDLVALVRDHRRTLKLTQFETDLISGNQDGYGSKLEGPGRRYGRRPTMLGKNLSVRFSTDTGEIVSVGSAVQRRAAPSQAIVTGPATWWLESIGLALVLMPREQATELCSGPVPFQRNAPGTRSGRRVRRVTTSFEVSGVGRTPVPVPSVRPEVLRLCAASMAKALKSGRAAAIARAIGQCRKAGLDADALMAAVSMTAESALAQAQHTARTAAYLHALRHPDVRVSVVDSVEHVRDLPPTEQVALEKDRQAWLGLSG